MVHGNRHPGPVANATRAATIAALLLWSLFSTAGAAAGSPAGTEPAPTTPGAWPGADGALHGYLAARSRGPLGEASRTLFDGKGSAEPGPTTEAAPEAAQPQPSAIPRQRAPEPFGRVDRALIGSYIVLAGLDAYQTANGPSNVREANPLLTSWAGDRPSNAEVLLFRGATTYGILKLTDRFARTRRTRRTRRTVLVLINVIQLAAVVHNEQVSGGIVF